MDFNQICEYILANTSPDNKSIAGAFYNIANTVREEGYLNLSIRLYEESLEYESGNTSVYNNIASIYKVLKCFKGQINSS